MKNRLRRLTVSAILIALGMLLSMVKVFELPYGGSVTMFSMLPIMLAAYLFGLPWGLLCGGVYGVLQALLGAMTTSAFAGQSVATVLAVLFIDYILAFAVLGFGGVFKNRIKSPAAAFSLGCLLAMSLRFAAHFTSGIIIWGSYAESALQSADNALSAAILSRFTATGVVIAYSFIYNASYMLPEMIMSVVAALLIIRVGAIKKIAAENN